MKKTSAAALLGLVLVAASFSLAENSAPKTPPAPSVPVLKSVSCPPDCGFMCRSHDEKELIEIVKAHAKNAHGKILTDEQIRSFMETEEPAAAPKKG